MKATKKSGVSAEVLPATQSSKLYELKRKFSDGKYLMILVLPSVICLALFSYFPMYGLIIAFKDYSPFDGIFGSAWKGFDHFVAFFNYPYFFRIIRNTFLLAFYNIIWSFPMPIILALLLNEVRSTKFKKFVQTISYMPHFYSTVVIVGLASMLLSPTGGALFNLFKSLGLQSADLLSEAKYFRTIYIATGIWQEVGWGAIIYLAALTNVDPQLYEAATVDGAGKMRCLWNITLPSIAPTVVTMLLLRMGSIFSVGFEKAYLLQRPVTYETSEVISTYVYEKGIVYNDESYSSAVGLFNSVISLVFVIVSNYVSRTVSETSLW